MGVQILFNFNLSLSLLRMKEVYFLVLVNVGLSGNYAVIALRI
jgi:hypothetical protein